MINRPNEVLVRWIVYFILAYVALAVQIGATPYVRWQGAPPNFVLLVVIFIALNAPREAALLGALCLGLMQDLVTQSPLGLYAVCYGLVGMFIVTMIFNVPLNNALAATDPASIEAASLWARYLTDWVFWNHVRTVASTVACALFIYAIAAR